MSHFCPEGERRRKGTFMISATKPTSAMGPHWMPRLGRPSCRRAWHRASTALFAYP